MRKAAKTVWMDRLHKGFVVSCVALTLYGCVGLGVELHHYFTAVRPLRQASREKAQQELLAEGRALEDSADVLKS